MKKIFLSLVIFVSVSTFSFCQSVGIGTAFPNNSAQLDISSTSKGILIPRMNSASITAINSPAKGLMIYDSSKNQLMVNMGTSIAPDWRTIVSKSGWSLTGNSGINPANQFIGNTDNQPLRFRINNVWAGELHPVSGNVFLGLRAGQGNTTTHSNVALGIDALKMNTDRSNIVAIGDSALYNNGITASASYDARYNTAIGSKSMYLNTIGRYNTAVGFESLYSNTSGADNTAIGSSGTLRSTTTGTDNTAIGAGALYNNITGNNNISIGSLSMLGNTTGISNISIGNYSLNSAKIGSYNIAIGEANLYYTTTSQFNTAIGFSTGSGFDIGYNNTLIGAQCDVNSNGLYNCVALGEAVTCTASSQARIGNSSTTSIGGQVDWTTFSDGRYKKNINENVKGIDFIMKLRPVTYQLDAQGISDKLNEGRGKELNGPMKISISEKEKIIFSGFVAQEVETAAKEAGYDFSGVDAPKNENDFYGLRYGDFVVPLVKTAQEQQAIILNQQQSISNLQKRLQSLEEQVRLLVQSSKTKN